MFEKANKMKLRFESKKGLLTTEDLWDLPLTGVNSLDNLAIQTAKKVRDSDDISFVAKKTPANAKLNLQLDILKHIIKVKLAEIESKESAKIKEQKKELIKQIIETKKNEALSSKSIEELEKELTAL